MPELSLNTFESELLRSVHPPLPQACVVESMVTRPGSELLNLSGETTDQDKFQKDFLLQKMSFELSVFQTTQYHR